MSLLKVQCCACPTFRQDQKNLWKKENVVLLREELQSNDGIIVVSDHGRVDEDERCIVKSLP